MQMTSSRVSPLVDDAISIWRAGVAAVHGKQSVINCAINPNPAEEHRGLYFGEHLFDRASFDRIVVIGAGKASAGMSQGLETILKENALDHLVDRSWINVPDNMADTPSMFHLHPARPAGINLPTEQVIFGTDKMLEIVDSVTERDLCIFLISGGGSALLAAPVPPITLDEKRQMTECLSASGADITQLNTVRQCVSLVKGGRLAARCAGGQMVSLVMSDIMGDPLDLIASGPTVTTDPRAAHALAILNQYDPDRSQIAASIYHVLESAGEMPIVKSHATNIVIANNAVAVDAAGVEAVTRHFDYLLTCDLNRQIDARSAAKKLVDWLISAINGTGPRCLISGGEPVVKLCKDPGRGGRNQQLVIEALHYLCQQDDTTLRDSEFVILSAGTDGEDGNTDVAGAWIDNQMLQFAKHNLPAITHHLRNNDAYRLFNKTGNLFSTGPTGTNVCDLRVVLVNRNNGPFRAVVRG
jgi:glycerate 2-kinase